MAAGWTFIGNLQVFLQKVEDAARLGVFGSSSQVSVDGASSQHTANFQSSPSIQFSQDSQGNITAIVIGGGGSFVVKQTEIDFGPLPVSEASFIITDASVTPSSRIVGSVAYEAPTGKDLDELEMDELGLKFGPGAGQFTLYATGENGYIAGKFKINYVVG